MTQYSIISLILVIKCLNLATGLQFCLYVHDTQLVHFKFYEDSLVCKKSKTHAFWQAQIQIVEACLSEPLQRQKPSAGARIKGP